MTNTTEALIAEFIKLIDPIRKMWESVQEVMAEFTEALKETNAREKHRAYLHMITPPHDHVHEHVNHTHTKPPHPARIYRRRTP